MKNWLKKTYPLWFAAIPVVVAIIYRDSFTSRFFQDDFLLLGLARLTKPLMIISHFPYRPISTNIFYSFSFWLFGFQPFGFHLLLFLFFVAGLFFMFRLTEMITVNKLMALFTVFIYATNISLFPLFYWIATSYFTLAIFFVFGSLLFFLKRGASAYAISLSFFVIGLLSNEIVVLTPIFVVFLYYLLAKIIPYLKLLPFIALDVIFLAFRIFFTTSPLAPDYELFFSPIKFLATFRWYLLRIFNLPEGVKVRNSPIIYLLFIGLVLTITVGGYIKYRKKQFPWRYLIFAFSWFLFGALPFFFLPGHMSSYYLSLSLFGSSLFFAKLFDKSKLMVTFCLIYLGLQIMGLNFVSQTHWIILKNTP